MAVSIQRKEAVYKWLNTEGSHKASYEFRRSLKLSPKDFYAIKKEWEIEKLTGNTSDKRLRKAVESLGEDRTLDGNGDKVDSALIKACENGNAGALKIYYQLTNRLIEKSEVKVKLSADEITRRNLTAERELEGFRGKAGYRVEEVQEKPALLSN